MPEGHRALQLFCLSQSEDCRDAARCIPPHFNCGSLVEGERASGLHVCVFLLVALVCSRVMGQDPSTVLAEFVPQASTQLIGKLDFSGSSISGSLLDAGDLACGFKNDFRIEIRNNTKADYRITSVKTNCGCLLAVPEEMVLAASSPQTVYVSLSPTTEGPYGKTVTMSLSTAGSENSIIQFSVKGHSRKLYSISPQQFDVKQQSGSLEFELIETYRTPGDVAIQIAGGAENLEINQPRVVGDKTICRLNWTKWQWKPEEAQRQIRIQFVKRSKVLQEIEVVARNPFMLVVKPSRAIPTRKSEKEVSYRFFLNGSEGLLDTLGDGGEHLRLALSRDKGFSEPELFAKITRFKRFSEELAIAEVSLLRRGMPHDRESMVGVWSFVEPSKKEGESGRECVVLSQSTLLPN